jgi:hypothetical protein
LKAIILKSEAGTFGYEEFLNGSSIVHQTEISGMPGNAGIKQTIRRQIGRTVDFKYEK